MLRCIMLCGRRDRVFCAFVFDTDILAGLPRDDRRVQFIHASLGELDARLRAWGAYLIVRHGRAADEIVRLAAELDVESVFANHDYEPQAHRARPRGPAAPARGRPQPADLQGPGDLRTGRGADPGRRPLLRLHALQERLAEAPGAPIRRRCGLDTAPRPARSRPRPRGMPCPRWTSSASRRTPAPIAPTGMSRRRAQLLDAFLDAHRRLRPRARFPGPRQHLAPVGAPALRHAVGPRAWSPAARCAGSGGRRRDLAVGADLARVLHDDPAAPSARGRRSPSRRLSTAALGRRPGGGRRRSPPGARAAPATRWSTRRWRS